MIINSKILAIPPHLSTSWKNIASLRTIPTESGLALEINMLQGGRVLIKQIDKASIDAIFATHARYGFEEEQLRPASLSSLAFPVQGATDLLDSFSSTIRHNPDQADAPEMPKEILEKIASLGKTLGLESATTLLKPQPGCKCPFCQIARAFQSCAQEDPTQPEEQIEEEDLKFRTWDIKQTGENLYLVSNSEDANEHYSVFLGEPLGCTCGNKHCDHIKAVLRS